LSKILATYTVRTPSSVGGVEHEGRLAFDDEAWAKEFSDDDMMTYAAAVSYWWPLFPFIIFLRPCYLNSSSRCSTSCSISRGP